MDCRGWGGGRQLAAVSHQRVPLRLPLERRRLSVVQGEVLSSQVVAAAGSSASRRRSLRRLTGTGLVQRLPLDGGAYTAQPAGQA